MHPLPGQPLPEGWVYIEHPDHGRAEAPVTVAALNGVWLKRGWTAVADAPAKPPAASPQPTTPASPAKAVAQPKE